MKYILLIWYAHPTVRLLTHFRTLLNEFQLKKTTDDGKKLETELKKAVDWCAYPCVCVNV